MKESEQIRIYVDLHKRVNELETEIEKQELVKQQLRQIIASLVVERDELWAAIDQADSAHAETLDRLIFTENTTRQFSFGGMDFEVKG